MAALLPVDPLHGALAACCGAADVMVLASSRRGWASVLVEGTACGTPVVASGICGPEVVRRDAGLVAPWTPEGVAAGVLGLWAVMPERGATRGYAEGFGWGRTSAGR